MNGFNSVGRLVKKPEGETTSSSKSYTRFTLAGERQADFISRVAWGSQSDFLTKYMDKGSLIGITGSILTGSYTNGNNETVYTTDVFVTNVEALSKTEKVNNQSPSITPSINTVDIDDDLQF